MTSGSQGPEKWASDLLNHASNLNQCQEDFMGDPCMRALLGLLLGNDIEDRKGSGNLVQVRNQLHDMQQLSGPGSF